jgi:hypothetical protein
MTSDGFRRRRTDSPDLVRLARVAPQGTRSIRPKRG